MRPFGKLMEKEEALRRLLAAAKPVRDVERVPLDRAAGRVLAKHVTSPRDVPGFDRSAMDGYAVRAQDTKAAPVALLIAGAQHARRVDAKAARVAPGTAVEIATGARIPRGADAVVPVEATRPARASGFIEIRESAQAGAHVRPRGHDVRRGARALAAGEPLTPARVGLAAALGLATLPVWRRPRVAIAPTGDELVPAGKPLRDGEIHESNSVALVPLLASAGADAWRVPPVADTLPALERALAAARKADVVVFTGGSSVGEKDLLVDLVEKRGRVLVHGVRVRPGKPLLVGTLRDGRLLVGLPGNPASALTNAALFVAPAVRRMARIPPEPARTRELPLAEDARAAPERYTVIPVRIHDARVVPVFKDSGAVTSVAGSDGWIGIEAGEARKAGERVVVTLW